MPKACRPSWCRKVPGNQLPRSSMRQPKTKGAKQCGRCRGSYAPSTAGSHRGDPGRAPNAEGAPLLQHRGEHATKRKDSHLIAARAQRFSPPWNNVLVPCRTGINIRRRRRKTSSGPALQGGRAGLEPRIKASPSLLKNRSSSSALFTSLEQCPGAVPYGY